MNTHSRRTTALLLAVPILALIGGCAGPYGWRRGPPPGRGWGMMGNGAAGYGYPGGMGMMGPGWQGYAPGAAGVSVQRHQAALRGAVPAAYADLRDPLPATPAVNAAGRRVYDTSCAACHGATGAGNGPAAAGLSPPAADLRRVVRRPIASDGYLMWAISEGGAPIGTPMPAFKGVLAEQDRWALIRFLRTL